MEILFKTIHGSRLWKMDKPDSDVDIFCCYQASSSEMLLGKMPISYEEEIAAENGMKNRFGKLVKVDIESHDIGLVIEQLLKGNINYVIGVYSDIVIQDWEHLTWLRQVGIDSMSKLCYESIYGMAMKNWKKFIQDHRDEDISQKKLNTIARLLKFGKRLLMRGEIVFDPVDDTRKDQVENMIKEFPNIKDESILPNEPNKENMDKLKNFLLNLRIEQLKNEFNLY